MGFYRKKPVVIEARQWSGTEQSATELVDWIRGKGGRARYLSHSNDAADIEIRTLEGKIYASPEDWVIRGVQGEFYPCKPDIFDATYEPSAYEPAEDKQED